MCILNRKVVATKGGENWFFLGKSKKKKKNTFSKTYKVQIYMQFINGHTVHL